MLGQVCGLVVVLALALTALALVWVVAHSRKVICFMNEMSEKKIREKRGGKRSEKECCG